MGQVICIKLFKQRGWEPFTTCRDLYVRKCSLKVNPGIFSRISTLPLQPKTLVDNIEIWGVRGGGHSFQQVWFECVAIFPLPTGNPLSSPLCCKTISSEAGARRQGLETFFSHFVPLVCAHPFRTHVQEGGKEGCVQALLPSGTYFGLQVVTPRQGRMQQQQQRVCDHAVSQTPSRRHLSCHLPHADWAVF